MRHSLIVRKNPAVQWKLPFSAGELRALFAAMLEAAGRTGATAELSILDDAAMSALHAQRLGCHGPTNILAFPAPPALSPGGADFLGWLALSADTLERECLLYGQEPSAYCIRLLAHGLAHLLGLDHGPAMDRLACSLEKAALAVSGGMS